MLKMSGLGLLLLGVIIGFITGKWVLISQVLGIIGIASLLISGVLTGIFGRGDRIRANYTNESDEERSFRQKWSSVFFLIALPNFIGAAIIYYVIK